MAETLDYFLPGVTTQDTKKRLQTYNELVGYLQQPNSSLYCEDLPGLVEGLAGWISCSNYKVSLNGLTAVSLLVDRTGDHFKSHVTTVLSSVVDRLGDSKDQVREASREVIVKLMGPATPQYVVDRVGGAFTHKLWHVREGILLCLENAISEYGAKSLTLSKVVPSVIKLLEDQSIPVRDAAMKMLVEAYRHVGERVRNDIAKRDVPQARLAPLFAKMDEIKNLGLMLAPDEQDDVDFVKPVGVPRTAARRQPSSGSSGTSGAKRSTGGAYSSSKSSGSMTGSSSASQATPKRKKSAQASSGASTGAMDEDAFISSFEDVTKVNLYSNRELSERLGRIKDVLSDGNFPWEKRVEALKEVRAIIVAGGAEYDDFYQLLRQLEPSFQLSARDLRSQVVREACLSIAYLSQSLPDGKFDHFAESSLQNLISLIPNSAKIMSTAGTVCIRFLLKHTHAPRLVPIITGNLTSKSNVIRRECLECLVLILHTWPTNRLEKHAGMLSDVIKKGLTDADQDARGHARKAYWGYADHFKSHADRLMQSLDPSKQSQLQGVLSNSSSNNSVNSTGGASRVGTGQNNKSRSRSMSSERQTTALYSRTMSGAKKPVNKPSTIATDTTDGDKRGAIPRSNSAADLSGTPVTSSGYGRKPASSSHGTSHTANYSSLRKCCHVVHVCLAFYKSLYAHVQLVMLTDPNFT